MFKGKSLWGCKACVCAKKILKLLYSAGTNTDLKFLVTFIKWIIYMEQVQGRIHLFAVV
jgi:hypothetical protein